jgi:hypothetical protein
MKKKSTPKKSKNNTKKEKYPSFAFLNNYRNRTTRKDIVTEIFAEKLADELVDWATNSKRPTSIEKFMWARGLEIYDLRPYRKKYPFLDGAYQFVKMGIGADIEEKGLYREMDSGSAERKLPQYLKRCAKDREKIINLKAKAAAKEETKKEPTTFNIIMPDYTKKTPSEPIKKIGKSKS